MAAPGTVEIRTARLLLRQLVHADAPALLDVHADPYGIRYSNSMPWKELAQAHDLIEHSGTWLSTGRHVCLGIVRTDMQTVIGTCTLYDINRASRRAEVGFILGSFAWGHGYMIEALTAVLDHAFANLDLNRIEADTDPRNGPAIRTLEKLGFVREGLLRERWITDGQKSDTAFYGLLRRDWPDSSER